MNSFKELLQQPVHFFAFGFGSGLVKPASGTWGTLAGLLLFIPLSWILPKKLILCLIVIAFIAGCWICAKTSHDLGVHDFSGIVWDEIVAIWLVLALFPQILQLKIGTFYSFVLAFVLFRLFDIWKPYPICLLDEKLKSGFGIMIDDILAAFYALLLIYAFNYLVLWKNILIASLSIICTFSICLNWYLLRERFSKKR